MASKEAKGKCLQQNLGHVYRNNYSCKAFVGPPPVRVCRVAECACPYLAVPPLDPTHPDDPAQLLVAWRSHHHTQKGARSLVVHKAAKALQRGWAHSWEAESQLLAQGGKQAVNLLKGQGRKKVVGLREGRGSQASG